MSRVGSLPYSHEMQKTLPEDGFYSESRVQKLQTEPLMVALDENVLLNLDGVSFVSSGNWSDGGTRPLHEDITPIDLIFM